MDRWILDESSLATPVDCAFARVSATSMQGRHDVVTAMDGEVSVSSARRSLRAIRDRSSARRRAGAARRGGLADDPIDVTANYSRGIPITAATLSARLVRPLASLRPQPRLADRGAARAPSHGERMR